MAAAKAAAKAQATSWVPQGRDEVTRAIAEIGELQRSRAMIQAQMNDELARIKESFEAEAQPLGERMTLLTEGVKMWCEVNRAALTRGGKTKTAALPSGEVSWRTSPPRVSIKGIPAVMDALKRLGLAAFIRTKEEIDKEAILREPEKVRGIKGIAISQSELFVIKPFETELEEIG